MKTKRTINAALRKEMSFLEALARRCPQDVDVLKTLGDLYTRTGCYEDGLKTDLELSRLCSREPLVWYNLACSYALLDRTDEALASLERAIVMGYRDVRWIREDRDLNSLKKDQRFDILLQRLTP
ncbi:MAG: tetratricopeptide repeat protein [Verrucomicrobia bacterium]|nr:tetratricopeptide repeat protein [Verrucomicrobiota bacterium]MBU1733691.1 tetratricopeptide repeat protein [Verrucomicrobiota bacterium]MBU1856211.1 tetratricopeptide repeat protein [Verrucomicrobiota bacterium]